MTALADARRTLGLDDLRQVDLPRCTTRGCPVRFRHGSNRACRWHGGGVDVPVGSSWAWAPVRRSDGEAES